MKIVINALSARLGGGQTYLKNLLAHLPANPNLTIIIFAPSSLQLPEDPRVHRREPAWRTENPIIRAIWERFVLKRILKNEKADILFCPGGLVSTPLPSACRSVTMFRNMIPFDRRVLAEIPLGKEWLRNKILKSAMLGSMRNADLTIFISDYARGVIEALTSLRKATTIPHGIGVGFKTAGMNLKRPAALPSAPYVLYVSKFDSYKHHREVISGFCSLAPGVRKDHHLVLVGETDHPLARRGRELARDKGLESQVHIQGAVLYEDLPAYYHYAEVVVFASSCENCPNILLEALGSGRPVMCSDVMPMPEFGGPHIAYFSPFSEESVAQSLAMLLSDANYAESVTDAAVQRSLRYDWTKTAAKTWESIGNLVSGASQNLPPQR